MLQYIGIGLSKTGTSSLCEAFKLLGYNTKHYLNHHQYKHLLAHTSGYTYEFVDDFPMCIKYQQLSKITPTIKAILTVRDVDSWIASCRIAWANDTHATEQNNWNAWKKEMFGTISFNETIFRQVYNNHTDEVLRYYHQHNYHQLLIMDITAGDGWDKLCPFIGVDIPDLPLPYMNKTH